MDLLRKLASKLFCKHNWQIKETPLSITFACLQCGEIKTERIPCCHNWEKIHESQVFARAGDALPIRRERTYCCKRCGDFKKVEI